ncbi:hypothetical protein J6590_008443 [Homalodisca vitripennis]|nr:hypothetical protein J6590_008443 [Homalodisca vitripennis]
MSHYKADAIPTTPPTLVTLNGYKVYITGIGETMLTQAKFDLHILWRAVPLYSKSRLLSPEHLPVAIALPARLGQTTNYTFLIVTTASMHYSQSGHAALSLSRSFANVIAALGIITRAPADSALSFLLRHVAWRTPILFLFQYEGQDNKFDPLSLRYNEKNLAIEKVEIEVSFQRSADRSKKTRAVHIQDGCPNMTERFTALSREVDPGLGYGTRQLYVSLTARSTIKTN